MHNYFNGKETRASVLIGIFLLLIILFPMFRSDSGQLFQDDTSSRPPVQVVSGLDVSVLRRPPFTTLQSNVFLSYGAQQEARVGSTLEPFEPFDIKVIDMEIGKTLYLDWSLPADTAITGWRIYRSMRQFQTGELIAEIPDRNQSFYYDSGLLNNQRYYYLVRAVNKDRLESGNTEQIVGIATDTSAPAAPTNIVFRQVPGRDQLEISWKNPGDDDFSYARVYRSDIPGQLGTMVADNVTGEGFIDTVDPSQEYYYTLTAVDTSGNESAHELVTSQVQRNIFEPTKE